jgi:hypothetical protein
MKQVDTELHRVAVEQHQLISRSQFLRIGSRGQLDRRLASGALIRVHDSVYRLPGIEPTWRQKLLAACMAGGRPSAASFRAAAQLMHLPGGEELIEVTFPRHRRAMYEGVIAHESRYLTEKDLLVIDGIPVTKAARTLCDLAALVEWNELGRSVLDHALLEAVRRDLVDVSSVWCTYERLGGDFRDGGVTIHAALQRFVPPIRPTETPAESRVLQILREQGMPEPVPQFWIRLPNDDPVRLDFAWPDRRVGLEFDPYKYHGDRERYEKMMSRTRLMQAIQWQRVCVTDDDLNAGMPESLAALKPLVRL